MLALCLTRGPGAILFDLCGAGALAALMRVRREVRRSVLSSRALRVARRRFDLASLELTMTTHHRVGCEPIHYVVPVAPQAFMLSAPAVADLVLAELGAVTGARAEAARALAAYVKHACAAAKEPIGVADVLDRLLRAWRTASKQPVGLRERVADWWVDSRLARLGSASSYGGDRRPSLADLPAAAVSAIAQWLDLKSLVWLMGTCCRVGVAVAGSAALRRGRGQHEVATLLCFQAVRYGRAYAGLTPWQYKAYFDRGLARAPEYLELVREATVGCAELYSVSKRAETLRLDITADWSGRERYVEFVERFWRLFDDWWRLAPSDASLGWLADRAAAHWARGLFCP